MSMHMITPNGDELKTCPHIIFERKKIMSDIYICPVCDSKCPMCDDEYQCFECEKLEKEKKGKIDE